MHSLLKVCELDIIFHFEKAYYVLDELVLCGEMQETSKDGILRDVDAQDLLQEVRWHTMSHDSIRHLELSA